MTNRYYNLDFKAVEFDHVKMQMRFPFFVLSIGKWITKINVIGIF